MHNPAIFFPMFALVAWTFCVLLWILVTRAGAAARREVRVDDFKYGESTTVPDKVCLPNRNYMNLLELPMLFYVVCIVLFITGGSSGLVVDLAWAYVGLRVLHSLIHLSYNRVGHRLTVFAASNVVLAVLWVTTGMHLMHSAA